MRPILLLATLLAALATVPGPARAQAGTPDLRTNPAWTGQRVRVTLGRYAVGEIRRRATFTGEVIMAAGDSLVVLPDQTNALVVLRRHDVRRLLRSPRGPREAWRRVEFPATFAPASGFGPDPAALSVSPRP